jgi:hypothetical protein
MESLKPLEKITGPDSRNLVRVFVNLKTGAQRKNALKDMHDAVSVIALGPNVPAEIRSQFAAGQNLTVYAWFCYHFHINGQDTAGRSIEPGSAFHERFGPFVAHGDFCWPALPSREGRGAARFRGGEFRPTGRTRNSATTIISPRPRCRIQIVVDHEFPTASRAQSAARGKPGRRPVLGADD